MTIENFVHIEGNLATEPEIRSLSDGRPVCNLVVAMNERRLVDGKWVDTHTSYIDVAVYGGMAPNLHTLSQGDRVTVEGKLTQNVWVDKSTGEKKFKVRVIGNSVSRSLRFAEKTAVNLPAIYSADEEPV